MTAKKEKTVIQQAQPDEEKKMDVMAPAPMVQDFISVVIPYCKEFAQGKELLFALRSWEKNARFGGKMVIIGDREEWFGEEVIHIEHKRISDNPQIDTLDKLYQAIASPLVTDTFIWSNDDIYLVNPVSLAHIELPKVLGMLEPEKHAGVYGVNMQNTINWLRERNLPELNYGTHTPFIFEKAKLMDVLKQLPDPGEKGYLFSSLYFNSQPDAAHPAKLDWKIDPFLLPVVSSSPKEEYVVYLLSNKVFMNNAVSGYSHWLEDFLDRMFPDESQMED